MNRKPSSFFRVDEQVFFTMGALCIVSLIIVAFRVATHTPCTPVKIVVNTTVLIEGTVIRFKAETQTGKLFSWNFGDGTLKDEESAITNHEYKKAGRYTVSVMVNGECSDMQTIVVDEAPVIVNTNLQPMIMGPDTAYLREPVSFSDISTASTAWEWRFGETSSIDATTKDPSYTYTIPGRKMVLLKINNRADLVTSHVIYVIDKEAEKNNALARQKAATPSGGHQPQIIILPAKPSTDPIKTQVQEETRKEEPAKPKAPKITTAQLEAMLMEVVNGSKRAEDFTENLCGQLGISVTLDGNVMPFTKMCQELKDTKRVKKIKVIPTLNENNCVLTMNVNLEKKKKFGLF